MPDTPEPRPDAEFNAEKENALRQLVWPRRLTQLGMTAERFVQAFWPLWCVLALALVAVIFSASYALPLELVWIATVFLVIGTGASLWYGIRLFRIPSRADAEARLDHSVPGRPLETLRDLQAIGATDPGSRAVWNAHLRRIAARAKGATAVLPDLRIADRDPYALRYVGATAVAIALLFGGLGQVRDLDTTVANGGQALATGPAWEGWIEPPSYTGKPSLYLNDLADAALSVPEGSRITLRLYGLDGSLSVRETVSEAPAEAPTLDIAQEVIVAQDGVLAIEGENGRSWELSVIPDEAPTIEVGGPVTRSAMGEMELPFNAADDYAVIGGTAQITLDLPNVSRTFGLSTEPEPRETIVVNIPLSISGDRSEFSEILVDNFSEHPWANLPVSLTFSAEDDLRQEGTSEPFAMVLPGRRFFDPMAQAIIEQRRDLLWSRENALRVSQILRAVSHRPDGFITNDTAYLMLRTALSQLIVGIETSVTPELQAEVAEALWNAALQFEEGDLANAAERLRRAQERLSEAMRDGATDEEIAELMQELREAMQDMMREMAEQFQRDMENGQQQQQAENQQDMQEITGDQMQDMMDQLQELMEQGRMDEAQALLDQMMQMMQNMQMAQGQQGQQSPGAQAMEGLQETLREQQGLADEAFRDLQNQQGQQPGQQQGQQQPGQQQGQQQGQGQQGQQGQQFGQGQQPGQGPGQTQPGQQQGQGQAQSGEGMPDADTLAQRQQQLGDILDQQAQNLPGAGTELGDAARDALDRAGRSMDDAANALEEGDLAEALDNQSDAMDAIREGMENLGEQMAQQQQQQQPGGQQGQANAQAPNQQRDPLGRDNGNQGRLGTDENLLQGEDRYRRAQELLDEIRRRSGEQERPDAELDYLKRLLDRF